MASLPTKTQEHGKKSLGLVVTLLPIQRHNTQQPHHSAETQGVS